MDAGLNYWMDRAKRAERERDFFAIHLACARRLLRQSLDDGHGMPTSAWYEAAGEFLKVLDTADEEAMDESDAEAWGIDAANRAG